MKYDLNFRDLQKLLEELVGKKRKRTNSGAVKGIPFGVFDTFHPGIASILSLIKFTSPKIIKDVYQKTLESISLINVYLSKPSKLSEDWGPGFFQLWMPFAIIGENKTLRASYDEWFSLEKLHFLPEQIEFLKIKKNMTEKEIASLLDKSKKKISIFLNFLGESYANSITHGINTAVNDLRSPMLSLISQKVNTVKNTEKWVMIHADMGMTILENLKTRATKKISGMNDHQILKWVMKRGSSSKPDTQKIKGGGFTVLKEVLLLQGKLEIISGPYHISVTLKDEKNIPVDADDIEKVTDVKVKKLNYMFPGTLTWIELNIDNNEYSTKKLIQLNDKIKNKRQAKLKEFIYD